MTTEDDHAKSGRASAEDASTLMESSNHDESAIPAEPERGIASRDLSLKEEAARYAACTSPHAVPWLAEIGSLHPAPLPPGSGVSADNDALAGTPPTPEAANHGIEAPSSHAETALTDTQAASSSAHAAPTEGSDHSDLIKEDIRAARETASTSPHDIPWLAEVGSPPAPIPPGSAVPIGSMTMTSMTIPGAFPTHSSDRAVPVERAGDDLSAPSLHTLSATTITDTQSVHSSMSHLDLFLESLAGSETFQFVQATLVDEEEPEPFTAPVSEPQESATTIVEAKLVHKSKTKLFLVVLLLLTAAAAIVLGVTLSVAKKETKDDSKQAAATSTTTNAPTPEVAVPPKPMLQQIRERGVLRCGVAPQELVDVFFKDSGVENTFESDMCRAIAAAIMGRDNYQIDLVETPFPSRIENLENGKFDVLMAGLSWTMDRDVYLPDFQRGLGFSAVYSTLSSGFGGIPQYVACAQKDFQYLNECAGMKVCTINGTRFHDALTLKIPRHQLHLLQSYADFHPAMEDGSCNVIASTFVNLNFLGMEIHQVRGDFVSGEGFYSTEPLSIVTQKDDQQWTNFCKYVMLSLFAAEHHNITSRNVLAIHQEDTNNMAPTRFQRPTVFGEEYKDMFINAVAVAGSYGEMEDNRINSVMLPREPINQVNNGTTGIIHSFPFGQITNQGPSFDSRFPQLWNRGKLRCAIRTVGRPGFAERIYNATEPASYSGMDVDYCLAIAASIFNHPVGTVEFVEVETEQDGFDLLQRGEVDVLTGVSADMERDVKDQGTGVGFSFSTPYFYSDSADGTQRSLDANLCLGTREDKSGWSEYVFWIVQATFYAEEENITRLTANEMPTVSLYGERFTRIFRDAISAVGSYGEIYEQNVQSHIPRKGMNMLLDRNNPTPLFYIPPGIIERS